MNQFGVPLVGYNWFTKERSAQNIFNLVKQDFFFKKKSNEETFYLVTQ